MKKYILIVSFLFSLIVPAIRMGLIDPNYKYDATQIVFNMSIFFIPVFIFSLITYFAPERVFASWWKFARIAIPAIFIPVLLINMEVHHNPNGDWQDIFDLQALILLYSIFILGSAWQIWKGWRNK